eukprot:Partr_v1_DN26465_c0_g1_i1_m23719
MLSIVAKVLAHGATRVGSQKLKRSGFRSGGSNDNRVLKGIVMLQSLHELGDGGTFLTHSDVDTVQLLLLIRAVIPLLLVQDSIESDSSLSSLTITNDQFTLTTTDGNHRVDTLDTGLHGLANRLTGNNAGCLDLHTETLDVLHRTLAVDGIAESVDNTAQESLSRRHVHNVSGTLDGVSLLDLTIISKHDDTDIIRFQVQSHALNTGRELHHLLGLDIAKTIDTSNTVTDGQDTTGLLQIDILTGAKDAVLQNGSDFRSAGLGLNSLRVGESPGRGDEGSPRIDDPCDRCVASNLRQTNRVSDFG